MSSSLYLFQNQQTLNDLVGHLELLADGRTRSFQLSFGVGKNFNGEKRYSATIIATDNYNKDHVHIIEKAIDAVELFQKIESFLNTLIK